VFALNGRNFELGNQDGYRQFWTIYHRPPKSEYRDYLLERRDSLIPIDERSFKGAYYTPLHVVDKAYDKLSETLGKNRGDDLREGKPTLPLIYLLNHGSAKEKALAQQAIQQVDTCDEAFFEEVLRTVRSSGALEYTLEQAMLEAEKARSCLASFPKNAHTEALQKLCDYSLARSS
jgi:hypothetical protein